MEQGHSGPGCWGRSSDHGRQRHVPPHDETLATTRKPCARKATPAAARRAATASRGILQDAEESSVATTAGETFLALLHLDLSEEDLEIQHPRIVAPPEEPLEDLVQHGPDQVY